MVVAAFAGCAEQGQREQAGVPSGDYVSWPAVSRRVEANQDRIDPSTAAAIRASSRIDLDQYGFPILPTPNPATDEFRSWYPEPSSLLSTDSWNPGFAPGPKLFESVAFILHAKGQPPRVVPLKIDWGVPLRRWEFHRGEFDPGMEDDGQHR
jgi:hypothetical protein